MTDNRIYRIPTNPEEQNAFNEIIMILCTRLLFLLWILCSWPVCEALEFPQSAVDALAPQIQILTGQTKNPSIDPDWLVFSSGLEPLPLQKTLITNPLESLKPILIFTDNLSSRPQSFVNQIINASILINARAGTPALPNLVDKIPSEGELIDILSRVERLADKEVLWITKASWIANYRNAPDDIKKIIYQFLQTFVLSWDWLKQSRESLFSCYSPEMIQNCYWSSSNKPESLYVLKQILLKNDLPSLYTAAALLMNYCATVPKTLSNKTLPPFPNIEFYTAFGSIIVTGTENNTHCYTTAP